MARQEGQPLILDKGAVRGSAVAQRYARITRKLEQDSKVMKEWEIEAADILSRGKG